MCNVMCYCFSEGLTLGSNYLWQSTSCEHTIESLYLYYIQALSYNASLKERLIISHAYGQRTGLIVLTFLEWTGYWNVTQKIHLSNFCSLMMISQDGSFSPVQFRLSFAFREGYASKNVLHNAITLKVNKDQSNYLDSLIDI